MTGKIKEEVDKKQLSEHMAERVRYAEAISGDRFFSFSPDRPMMNCPKCGALIPVETLQHHREKNCRY